MATYYASRSIVAATNSDATDTPMLTDGGRSG
jgi:hypothetical protein